MKDKMVIVTAKSCELTEPETLTVVLFEGRGKAGIINKLITEPTPSGDVEGAIETFRRLLNDIPLDKQNIEEVRNKYPILITTIRQALTPKKITNEEVEGLFTQILLGFPEQVTPTFDYTSEYQALDKLKQAYINQQEEIEALLDSEKVLMIDNTNKQIKLDKIEEIVKGMSLGIHRKQIMEIEQILKENKQWD